MLEILLNIGIWYLKIGLVVYLAYQVLLVIKHSIMPWNLLGIIVYVCISPVRLLTFIIVTIVMITTWPVAIFIVKDLLSKGGPE